MDNHIIGKAATFLHPNEMKKVVIAETEMVVARTSDGDYFAFGATCSHFGAPLEEGVLSDHTLMCPWHHACFNVRNGARV